MRPSVEASEPLKIVEETKRVCLTEVIIRAANRLGSAIPKISSD